MNVVIFRRWPHPLKAVEDARKDPRFKTAYTFTRTSYPPSAGYPVPTRVQGVILQEGKRFDFDTEEGPQSFYRRLSDPFYQSIRPTIETVMTYVSKMNRVWGDFINRKKPKVDSDERRADRQSGL